MSYDQINSLDTLIESTEQLLKEATQIKNIGNRPHFPMLIMLDDGVSSENWSTANEVLTRSWTQTAEQLAVFNYTVTDDEVVIIGDAHAGDARGNPIAGNQLQEVINSCTRAGNGFAETMNWQLFNVIDTSNCTQSEDFLKRFNALEKMKEMLGNPCMTMLVVILRDERAQGEDTASSIRSALAVQLEQESTIRYDSIVLISDRSRNNVTFDNDYLYNVLGNLLFISNNDAVSTEDDESFRQRVSKLYQGEVLSLSYLKKSRPNIEIAYQMNDMIISALSNEVSQSSSRDEQMMKAVVGRCKEIIDSFTNTIMPQSFHAAIEALPLKSATDYQIWNMPANVFLKEFAADGNILSYLAENCTDHKTVAANLDSLKDSITSVFDETVPLSFWSDKMLELRDMISNEITAFIVDESSYVDELFINLVRKEVFKEHIAPLIGKQIEKKIQLRKKLQAQITVTKESFEIKKPTKGYAELGTLYENSLNMFMQSERGKEAVRHALELFMKDQNNLYEGIFYVCKDYIKRDPDSILSLSFVEEWEKRLSLTGDMIYRQIGNDLMYGMTDSTLLYGNYPIQPLIKVYLMHTLIDYEKPTELYKHLKETFKEEQDVVYVNTGYDYMMEAIAFVQLDSGSITL